MTRRQFSDLRPGDRVRWRGADTIGGAVIDSGLVSIFVRWDDGEHCVYAPSDAHYLELAPTEVEQVRR